MRRSVIALGVLAAVLLISWGFQPEAAALLWHLRHGVHAEGAGVRLRVPLLYEATASPDALVLTTSPGRVRKRQFQAPMALIMLSNKAPNPKDGEPISNSEMLALTLQQHEHLGAKQTAKREFRLGSETISCLQFEGGSYLAGVDIWCAPASGGPIVSFGGGGELAGEFYGMLQSAERISR